VTSPLLLSIGVTELTGEHRMHPTEPLRDFGRARRWFCGSAGDAGRWAGESRGWSRCGRSEVIVLVREVLWVTAVRPASYGGATAVGGESRGRSERGRSEVVVVVREVWRVTAVRAASCGGRQRPCAAKVVAGQSAAEVRWWCW
jgi:hypothetical protein